MTKPLSGFKRVLSLIGLALATFLIILDYTIANVSIPYISGDLSVSANQGTYIITSFTVGNAIILPISGWLTERIGGVRLLFITTLLFVLFSWVCGSAPNFETLLVGRFLQGFVSGPLIPLSQSLIVSTNPPEKKNSVLAFWSTVVIVAPVIGPVLGGWISFDYHWSWIFYINIPFGLLSAILIWYTLSEYHTKTKKTPVDFVGFFLLSIGVLCLQIILDKGEQYNWLGSSFIVTLAIISTLAFTYFLVWEKLHPYPIVELSLFKIHSYAISVLFMGVMYAMYFGSVVLIPLWLQVYMGYNAIWAGIAVAPIGLAPTLFSIFTGKLVNRFGTLIPLAVCFVLFSVSCFYTAYFTTAVDLNHLWMSRFLLGCGLVFFITPLFSLSIQDIETKKLTKATGIFHFVRAMSGGVGTSLFTTLWIRRMAFHHERVGSALTPTSENMSGLLDTLKSFNIYGEKALTVTNDLLDKQAAMLALNDCFYLMGWLFLALIILLPLGRKKKGSAEPSSDHHHAMH